MDSVLQLLRAFHDKADALCLEAATYASPYLDRVGPEGSLLRTYAAILAVGGWASSAWVVDSMQNTVCRPGAIMRRGFDMFDATGMQRNSIALHRVGVATARPLPCLFRCTNLLFSRP